MGRLCFYGWKGDEIVQNIFRGGKLKVVAAAIMASVVAACAGSGDLTTAMPQVNEGPGDMYVIGPLDTLEIFVWRNPELSTSVTVRPDGRISVPLIEDLPATGQTPTELARAIEAKLAVYIQSPIATVIVSGFQGPFAQQVRVVGEAANPQAIPYRANMTLLDVMIAVGGLTEYAAGNRAKLVRFEDGQRKVYGVKIASLIKDGNIRANVAIKPGDILIIPESFF